MKPLYALAIVAECYMAIRIVSSPVLREHYRWFAVWLTSLALADVIRIHANLQSWDYSVVWAWTAWPCIIFGAFMAWEYFRNINRQYGPHNQTFVHRYVLAGVSVFLALGCVEVWMASRLWLSGSPTIVEIPLVVSRLMCCTWLGVLVAQWVLLWIKPLPICPNLRWASAAFALNFAVDGAANYLDVILWPFVDHAALLNVLGVANLLATIICWGVLSWKLQPAEEWDVVAEMLTAADQMVLRERDNMVEIARRLRKSALRQIQRALYRGRPLRSL